MDEALASISAGIEAGGIFIYPLLAVALLALGCAIDRAYIFMRFARLSRPLARLLDAPAPDTEAIRRELARSTAAPGFHARFLRAISDNSERPIWWIESRAADEAASIERRLDQGLWILETTVTAAPLLGLLGTIAGMIGAFRLFGNSGAVDPGAVTGGVAEALIATAIGIVIALFALAAYNYFSHRRGVTLDEMERLGSRLIDTLRLRREAQP